MRPHRIAGHGQRRRGGAVDGLAVAVPLVGKRAVVGRSGLHLQRARLAQVERHLAVKVGRDDRRLRCRQHVRRCHLALRHRGHAVGRSLCHHINRVRTGGKRRREARIRRAVHRCAIDIPLVAQRCTRSRRCGNGERRHRATRLHRHRRSIQVGGEHGCSHAIGTSIGRQPRGVAHLGAHRGAVLRSLPVDGGSARPILQHGLATIGVLLHEAIRLRALHATGRIGYQRIHPVLGDAGKLERGRKRRVLLELLGRVGANGLELSLRHVVAVRAGRGVHRHRGRVGGVAGQVKRGQRRGHHQRTGRAGLIELQARHAFAEVRRLLFVGLLRVGIAAVLATTHDQVSRRVASVVVVVRVEALAERIGGDAGDAAAEIGHIKLFGEAVLLDFLQRGRERHRRQLGAFERVVVEFLHTLGNGQRTRFRGRHVHKLGQVLRVDHAVLRRVVQRVVGHVDLFQAVAPLEVVLQLVNAQIAADGDVLKVLAVLEDGTAQAGHGVRHGEAAQAPHTAEGTVADGRDAIAQRHRCDIAIAREQAVGDFRHTVGDDDVAYAFGAQIGTGEAGAAQVLKL